ncbi:MAG: response regulator, partial [Planctomycetota bacterium]
RVRQRAFDPFFSTRGPGRGMGLAAVLGTLRSHHGAVSLISTSRVGTRLRLILPPAERCGRILPQPPADPTREHAKRILVVDDEPMVRDVARRLLSRGGYLVEAAPSGEEALAVLEERGDEFACALIDITMPGLDGLKTLEQARALGIHVPVLMSSGFASQRMLERLETFEGVDFLRKPYRLQELLERLELAIASRDQTTT